MAKEDEVRPEGAILSTCIGEFHVMDVRPVKAAKGANKIRLLLECEYEVESAENLAPLFDKDCKVTLRELATKKRREKYGDDDGQPGLPGVEGKKGAKDSAGPST